MTILGLERSHISLIYGKLFYEAFWPGSGSRDTVTKSPEAHEEDPLEGLLRGWLN